MNQSVTNAILPLSAFKDNYIWFLFDANTRTAWVVDPGDAAPVMLALEKHNAHLAGILLTHHHADHSGGIAELVKHHPDVKVYGSYKSPIEYITHRVQEGDELPCCLGTLKVMEIPGHTLDHIAFYNDDVVFCGDTLFSVGCGKVFEGTHAQMYASLCKLMQLNDTTKVFCGHEYTLSNLHFAERVESSNKAIQNKQNQVKKLLDQHQPTLPSLLGEEKQINPFLRCLDPAVIDAVEKQTSQKLANAVDVFAALREWKNNS